MARQKRAIEESGWAHIILRGINRENLFYDDEDFERFRTTVERFQKEENFSLPIMCMMSNHVHFLLKDENNAYSQIMKKICVSFASYYNKKYDRVGPVFQDRFRSESVLDDRYYLAVIRYIFQNPSKAGICPANAYPHTILNRDELLTGFFGSESELMEFLNTEQDERCMDYDTTVSLRDEEAAAVIQELTGQNNPQMMQGMEKCPRDALLRELKAKGISVRQLSRLTGLNRNIIQRA